MLSQSGRMPRLMFIILWVVSSIQVHAQFSSAMPDIREYTIPSRVLGQDRRITIYKQPILPKYAGVVQPILYVLDGEMMSFYYCTLVNYMCERFPGIPPVIVVGIENEPSSVAKDGTLNLKGRDKDLTPEIFQNSTRYGGAEKFLQYIREELFPFVEKDHTKTPYRVFAGGSLAGFLVMHTFLQHPDMFNGYLASSPALQLNNSAYMKTVEETINKASVRNNRLYFSVGNEPDPYIPNARKIDSLLKNKNLKGLSYQFMYYPGEGHSTLRTYQDGFEYLFQTVTPEYKLRPEEISYASFEDHFKNLSKIFGFEMKADEKLINSYGYKLLNQYKDTDKALEFFKKNMENFPNSGNVYDSYAEALLKKGDKKNALINYEKAYQLDSTNTNARDIALKLKNE